MSSLPLAFTLAPCIFYSIYSDVIVSVFNRILSVGQTDRQVVASGRKLNLGRDLRWVAKRLASFFASTRNWSQITFFILANVISERFWPNFDQINILSRLLPFCSPETRPKSWKRRNAENYSRSIEMLLTLNRLTPEVSFVTLHMRWHKGCCSNSIHKNLKSETVCLTFSPSRFRLTTREKEFS